MRNGAHPHALRNGLSSVQQKHLRRFFYGSAAGKLSHNVFSDPTYHRFYQQIGGSIARERKFSKGMTAVTTSATTTATPGSVSQALLRSMSATTASKTFSDHKDRHGGNVRRMRANGAQIRKPNRSSSPNLLSKVPDAMAAIKGGAPYGVF